ncbi:MAG: hypothetical protein V4497_07870 [Bacteroidota bacterium]
MTFKGIDNQSVELKITNYQFPKIVDGDYDSNWLNIYLNVKSKVGHWQTIDPSLTTWDMQRLINWFDNLSNNIELEYLEIVFLEPNLCFELHNSFNSQIKAIRIIFDSESKPKSAIEEKEYFVDILANNSELKRIKLDLEKELENYPERKSANNNP